MLRGIARVIRHPSLVGAVLRDRREGTATLPADETLPQQPDFERVPAPTSFTATTGVVSVVVVSTRVDEQFLAAVVSSATSLGEWTAQIVVSLVGTSSVGLEVPANVRLLPGLGHATWESAANAGAAATDGEIRVFIIGDFVPERGCLSALVDGLRDSPATVAHPVVIAPNGTIASAGGIELSSAAPFADALADHPREDLPEALQLTVSALTIPVFAIRAADATGFDSPADPVIDDAFGSIQRDRFLVWARGVDATSVVAVTDAVVRGNLSPLSEPVSRGDGVGRAREIYRLSGFDIERIAATDRVGPGFARSAHPILHRRDASPDRLRWSIKIAAHADARGEVWGDTFFANDLAAALRQLGQDVVVDRLEAGSRPGSDYLDDVCVTIRGLHRVSPNPAATNVLWVISHPDAVDTAELNGGYDLVFAASEKWAASATAQSGVSVSPLLQATSSRFAPGPIDEGLASDVLFVGKSRGVFRPIIRDALALGTDIAIYGDGWEQFIPREHVRSEFLSNDRAPLAYRSARLVLNDHWDDMRHHGFISNRIFDAVASGALVITDDIEGLEIFGRSVHAYSSHGELGRLLTDRDVWPSDDERLENARRVGAEHSFDRRAETLLREVRRQRGLI